MNIGPIKVEKSFEILAGDLRERILSGAIQPGETLPNERELGIRPGSAAARCARPCASLKRRVWCPQRPAVTAAVSRSSRPTIFLDLDPVLRALDGGCHSSR